MFGSVFMVNVFVCLRPLSPSSAVCVYRSSGETPCLRCPVSTPSAKHAGNSTALYLSKMAWEWVSRVCVRVCVCVESPKLLLQWVNHTVFGVSVCTLYVFVCDDILNEFEPVFLSLLNFTRRAISVS